MPTLSLYSTPSVADASHEVTAPGGYEWWYFDAEDAEKDVQVVGILLHGFVFHPGYLRRYFRYVKAPTRHAPPMPSEYPCAYLAVYEKGRLLAQFMTQYGRGELASSASHLNVVVGPNRVTVVEGAMKLELEGRPWVLTGRGPKTQEGQRLRAALRFAPKLTHSAQERVFFSREMTGADHRWVIANPLCDVEGVVRIEGNGAVGARTIAFKGKGYHDHNYGSGPIGPGLRNWMWGRVLMEDRVCTFQFARPRDRSLPEEVHLVEGSEAELGSTPMKGLMAEFSRRTPLGLAYPAEVKFDDALHLSNPMVVDSAPFYMRLIYEARYRASAGRAFCEVAYPHRLRWPVLGRMIEMSVDRRGSGM